MADLTPDEEWMLQKFTRREQPAQRAARIRALKVPPERAAMIKRALGREQGMPGQGMTVMSVMGQQVPMGGVSRVPIGISTDTTKMHKPPLFKGIGKRGPGGHKK